MENIFFQNWGDLLRVPLMGICAYTALILLLRLSGKRALGQMNAFDFVVTVAIGSTLSSVIINKDVTLAEGVSALGILILLQYILTRLSQKLPMVERVIKARPNMLVQDGAWQKDSMRKERVTEDEIHAALRQAHRHDIAAAKSITLEANGNITVVYKE